MIQTLRNAIGSPLSTSDHSASDHPFRLAAAMRDVKVATTLNGSYRDASTLPSPTPFGVSAQHAHQAPRRKIDRERVDRKN
jgi:hypothetical protein